ncbi:MAG: hypothetical protein GY943_02855 [Chloroflexi bacterium]|nr:hypothetical protein [Chloroflexota bacterium]
MLNLTHMGSSPDGVGMTSMLSLTLMGFIPKRGRHYYYRHQPERSG